MYVSIDKYVTGVGQYAICREQACGHCVVNSFGRNSVFSFSVSLSPGKSEHWARWNSAGELRRAPSCVCYQPQVEKR